MSDEVLDDDMLKGNCKGKADAIVNCQCSLRLHQSAVSRRNTACFIPTTNVVSSGNDWDSHR